MVRKFGILIAVFTALTLTASLVSAGSPHFIRSDTSITRDGNTLTVTAKEAGLGDEPQVHVVLSATALCINPGSKHPRAANKADVAAEGNFPVQNGKADITL